VAIIGLIAHIIGMIIIGRYVAKIRYREAQLELRTKELEKKNGSEIKKIEDLEKTRQEDRKIIDNLQKELQELKSRS
jgi:hypothetical protein